MSGNGDGIVRDRDRILNTLNNKSGGILNKFPASASSASNNNNDVDNNDYHCGSSLVLSTFQEISKFAPVAFELGHKKGFLLVEDDREKRYFSLFGNILFVFDKFESLSFSSIILIESSVIKKVQNTVVITPNNNTSSLSSGNNCISSYSSTMSNISSSTSYSLSIQSFSGKVKTLTATNQTERNDWFDAFERNKYVNMTRLIEDMELRKITIDTRTDVHYKQVSGLESTLTTTREELEKALDKVKALEANNNLLTDKIVSLESEKSMLMRSKGITPKTVPQWAESSSTSPSNSADDSEPGRIPKMVKLWTGTWNLGNSDPFVGMDFAACLQAMKPFIPSGYDVYVLGVQESINESVLDVAEAILNAEGCYRFRGDERAASSNPMVDKLVWKGDGGSSGSSCFLGMAIFCKRKITKHCTLLSSAAINFKQSSSINKGALGVAMSIYGRSIVFVTSQLDAQKIEVRRQQYQQVTYELGGLLSEPGYHLNDIFHHIIWCGDLNFTLVDKSGNLLPLENAIKMLDDNFNRTLFESHDQLNFERKVNQLSFYGYREPSPFPNFYPTYKKIKNRESVDYTKKGWVHDIYVTKHKESLLKSVEVIPRFSDRILYHSMVDLAEDLIPECISQEFKVMNFKEDKLNVSPTTTSLVADGSSGKVGEGVFGMRRPSLPSAMLDNYQTVNDGSMFSSCDHSPVYCSFLLRLLHDHEQIRKEVNSNQGNIQSILSALALENTSLKSSPLTPPLSSSVAPVLYQQRTSTVARSEFTYESLLPPGERKIKISNIKLMWGGHEELPVKVKILFPVCYESIRGENFIDFSSDETYLNLDRSSAVVAQSPTKTTNRLSFARLSMGGSSKEQNASAGIDYNKKGIWLKKDTKTSTGIQVEYDASDLGNKLKSIPIPATQLQWFGPEPLDKLHIAIHVATPLTPAHPSWSSSEDDTFLTGNESSGLSIGHCSFGLEQLCKTALVSSSDLCASINIARLLLKDGGFPMTMIDPQSNERENVTLCCNVELFH